MIGSARCNSLDDERRPLKRSGNSVVHWRSVISLLSFAKLPVVKNAVRSFLLHDAASHHVVLGIVQRWSSKSIFQLRLSVQFLQISELLILPHVAIEASLLYHRSNYRFVEVVKNYGFSSNLVVSSNNLWFGDSDQASCVRNVSSKCFAYTICIVVYVWTIDPSLTRFRLVHRTTRA